LRHLVAKVAKLFEAGALEKGLTLETQVDDALSASYWCPDLIVREALINLVSNAVKFTETGWVSLSVKLENPSVEMGGHQIIFTVADSGPGIPANLRKTAFAPFETGITQETRHGGGTGLGAELYGGGAKTYWRLYFVRRVPHRWCHVLH
jgi:two-component system sensor histidine kinase EvgS